MPRTNPDPFEALSAALGDTRAASSDYDLNPNHRPPARHLRPAAVLVPLIETPGGLHVILTKRSSALQHHPGQIAFPGGKMDPTDASLEDAALREAHEEIGLHPASVTIMGRLPEHETVTAFTMTPIIGRLTAPFTPVPEPGEVAEVFSVPFDHIADPARYSIQYRRWRGERRYYYTVPYGPYYIWGATARILRGLAGKLSGEA
ncbi:8-oxo-dGTP pyrophosphatase MutT, NUDIX family [Poseidonocella pacifica]|uniref:8-oxo-dGTP pyrophosphatase MutT, NUDIX family n=1 Tax=Poseidonocella pacifica TaxID=871651 RepID=A0A1I0XVR7_9RHOB|nr:CoA pyrophosphatase [Poseidonocella pacifica]SFB05081.1 8-oxo-dGTP pyrophosphatase MutT, NUDIX family [Poseidonocella pacifica]